jgi:hypothetical protein
MTALVDTSTATVTSAGRRTVAPVPFRRVLAVEARKMFDTRSGFWLMASIVIASLIATGAVIVFAPEREQTYATFGTAVGFPMSVILPMVAILAVTGEYSQRTALTTFTLVPQRGRVVAAKAICAVAVGVVSMLVAFLVGALGNVVGTAIAGVDQTWNLSATDLVGVVAGNVLGLLVGFTLGVLLRSSAAAIVAYFVFMLVLPSALGMLAAYQQWFRDLRPWVDFEFARSALFNGRLGGEYLAHLGVASAIWLLLPLVVGLRLVLRSEVK